MAVLRFQPRGDSRAGEAQIPAHTDMWKGDALLAAQLLVRPGAANLEPRAQLFRCNDVVRVKFDVRLCRQGETPAIAMEFP